MYRSSIFIECTICDFIFFSLFTLCFCFVCWICGIAQIPSHFVVQFLSSATKYNCTLHWYQKRRNMMSRCACKQMTCQAVNSVPLKLAGVILKFALEKSRLYLASTRKKISQASKGVPISQSVSSWEQSASLIFYSKRNEVLR